MQKIIINKINIVIHFNNCDQRITRIFDTSRKTVTKRKIEEGFFFLEGLAQRTHIQQSIKNMLNLSLTIGFSLH